MFLDSSKILVDLSSNAYGANNVANFIGDN